MNCQKCTAETAGAGLCDACIKTTVVALADIASYYYDLASIQPGRGVVVRSVPSSTPPPDPGPRHDAVSERITYTRTMLAAWVRDLDPAGKVPLDPDPSSIGHLTGWLASHTDALAAHPAAKAYVDQIAWLERNLRKTLARIDTGTYAGRCTNELGRVETDAGIEPIICDRPLYAGASTNWVTCPGCGRAWDADTRRNNMVDQARDQYAPVRVIAKIAVGLLEVDTTEARLTRRIEQWVRRGRLTDAGLRHHPRDDGTYDPVARRSYRIGDVLDLLADTTKRATSKPDGDRVVRCVS